MINCHESISDALSFISPTPLHTTRGWLGHHTDPSVSAPTWCIGARCTFLWIDDISYYTNMIFLRIPSKTCTDRTCDRIEKCAHTRPPPIFVQPNHSRNAKRYVQIIHSPNFIGDFETWNKRQPHFMQLRGILVCVDRSGNLSAGTWAIWF